MTVSVEALAKAVSARAAGAEVRLRRVPDIVSPEVMAKVHGWGECSKRMLAEYGAPTLADAEWADGIIFGTPTRFGNTSAEWKAFIDSLGSLWFQGKLNGKAAGFKATGRRTDRHRFPDRTPPADDIEVAKHQGARVTQVAAALKAAR